MKANSRRRVLISSVAMLLVALVALSTATFAWFTSSTVATANGITVKTAKASKLQISKAAIDWQTNIDYQFNRVLLPASTASGTSWFAGNAAAATASAADATTIAGISDTANYVFKEQLNIKNNGEAAVDNVKITISGITNDYMRVALVPAQAAGVDATVVTGTDFTKCVYDLDGAAYDAVSGAYSETTKTFPVTNITPANAGKTEGAYEINVGLLNSQDVRYYNVYVWFEGQDEQCTDATAGATVTGLTFTVTGDTVYQAGTEATTEAQG